jgi:acetoin utilization protein AcuB
MNVGRRMSHPVITVPPNTPIIKVHELMARENINQCPVVKEGKLIGLITEKDILKAYPSSATTLAVWEITSLLEKIKVQDIMIKEFQTVQEDTPIETAARILVDHKISALPVLRGKELVGIITEADLFKIMLEMLGARRPGVRFSVLMENRPGEIAKLSQAIYKSGGDITALSTFEGDAASNFLITMKVDGIEQQALKELVEPLVLKLLSIGTSE